MSKQNQAANSRRMMKRGPYRGSFHSISLDMNPCNLKNRFSKTFEAHLLLIVLAIFLSLVSGAAIAAETKITPKIGVGGAYDDNIFLSTEDKVSSSIITVSPGLEMDYQTLLSNLSLKADLGYPELSG